MDKDQLTLQRAEFEALAALNKARNCIGQPVEDDFEMTRHRYTSALRSFLAAVARSNGALFVTSSIPGDAA
jgi:hypothetical protein